MRSERKRMFAFWAKPELREAVKCLSLAKKRTLQALLGEAVKDLQSATANPNRICGERPQRASNNNEKREGPCRPRSAPSKLARALLAFANAT